MTNPPPRRNLTHGILSERYHLGGRVETDTVAMAAARQEQAEIRRRHRLERRHGDDPSQTPGFSSLVARHEISQGTEALPPQRPLQSAGHMLPINNPALAENQPQLPRRGRPPKPRPTENVATEDSSLESEDPTIPHQAQPPLSAGLSTDEDSPSESDNSTTLPRRGRPLPRGNVGRPPLPRRDVGRPPLPRRDVGRPRNHSPNRQLQNFDMPPPVFSGNMQESPLSLEDITIKQKFDSVLADEEMRYCLRCKERWFDIQTQPDGVCKRCHQKDDKKKQDEPFFYSAANHLQ
jgi:ATP-dependent DNA helicase PIF1